MKYAFKLEFEFHDGTRRQFYYYDRDGLNYAGVRDELVLAYKNRETYSYIYENKNSYYAQRIDMNRVSGFKLEKHPDYRE